MISGAEKLLPVIVNGKPDKLTIIEIERVFGLPDDYTKLEDEICYTTKLIYLGSAWCTHTLISILRSLLFFISNESDNSYFI